MLTRQHNVLETAVEHNVLHLYVQLLTFWFVYENEVRSFLGTPPIPERRRRRLWHRRPIPLPLLCLPSPSPLPDLAMGVRLVVASRPWPLTSQ